MNQVDAALASTSDHFRGLLADDPQLAAQFRALLAQGQKPVVVSLVPAITGYVIVLVCQTPS